MPKMQEGGAYDGCQLLAPIVRTSTPGLEHRAKPAFATAMLA